MSVVVTLREGDHPVALPMVPLGGGMHELVSRDVVPGARYRFKLNDAELPDPYARRLPLGVHGPAEVVQSRYRWTADWKGLGRDNILYELHVGTFTREGTYGAAMDKLPALASLGVTAVELMPLSSAAGARGWGYDGVAHFAPFEPYGPPDELRRFVDACHAHGLGVILDVVYNHFCRPPPSCSWARNGARRALFSFSPITRRNWEKPSPRDDARNSPASCNFK